ncbi:MAG: DUF975 family protein [Eubacterium sp.]
MTYKNRIVTESNRLIMNISRSELRGRFGLVMLAVFLYFLLTAQVRQFFILFIPLGRQTINTAALGAYAKYAASGFKVSTLASSYNLMTEGAFVSGMCGFLLMFFRREKTDPVMVFSGFETPMRYIKSIEIMIIRYVLIIGGLLMFIFPGIIFAIRTSQANFLLMDDHSKTGMQCIRESWQLMRGNSMKFFNLILSYLPWLILSALPFAALLYYSPKNHVLLFLLATACYIPLSASLAYLLTGVTAFFDLMTGHLVIDRQ